MLQPHQTRSQVSFGPFTVDFRSAELKKHGVRVGFRTEPFEILTILLERPGEVVTRDELRNRLWPEGTFVDFDNNISASIGKLRGALSDSAATPRYIETVGRGYRFIADLRQVPETFEAPRPMLVPQAGGPGTPAQVAAPPMMRKSLPRSRRISRSRMGPDLARSGSTTSPGICSRSSRNEMMELRHRNGYRILSEMQAIPPR
jgi:DNA-binding winged helix-turn-helix (wHTH) protein